MNYMEEVAHILGVELGEIFTTEAMDDIWHIFTETGLVYYDDYDEMWWEDNDYFTKLLTGEDKVVKLRKVGINKYERM